jgi:membrane protein
MSAPTPVRESKKWQMLLGAAELGTVVLYAWHNARRLAHAEQVLERRDAAEVRRTAAADLQAGSAAVDADQHPALVEVSAHHEKALRDGPLKAAASLLQGYRFGARALGEIAVEAAKSWSVQRAASKGAALALYTLFSLAPMLMLVIAVAGLFFGADAVREMVTKQMSGMLGAQGADAIKSILAGAHFQSDSITAAAISAGLLLVGATSAFSELKDSLDELWQVPKPAAGRGIWWVLRERVLSFGLVLVLALMLLISLAVSTLLALLGDLWIGGSDSAGYVLFARIISEVVSFSIVTVLFATIYKYLPAVRIAWRDVLVGSVITAVLFVAGKYLIGLYLSTTNFRSGYGAAGSLVLLVSWIYYSAQIFFYGALFTHEHAARSGRAAPTPKPPEPVAA